MGKMEQWLESLSEEEKSRRETDHGEMSAEDLKKWFRWAITALLVCTVLTSIWAAVSSVRDQKEAAVLEVDSGTVLELYLNRKGVILKAKGSAESVLKDYSIEEGIDKLLGGLAEHGRLGEGGAVIFTLRSVEGGIQTDLERLAEEIYIHSELFLRKSHSDGTVYVDVLKGNEIDEEMAEKYGVSYGKAALARNLIDKNTELENRDLERLLGMSVDDISAEITEEKYDTTFVIVTAKQVYAKWQEMEETTKQESASEVLSSEDTTSVKDEEKTVIKSGEENVNDSETAETEDGNIQEGMVDPENERETEDSDEAAETEPTEPATEAQMYVTTKAATEAATQATTEARTEAAVQATTAVQTEAATQATTAVQTEAATQATTAVQTEAVTQATTEAPTTEAPTTEASNHGTLSPSMGASAGSSIIQEVVPVSPGN